MHLLIWFVLILGIVWVCIFLYTWYRLRTSIYIHTTPNSELIATYPLPKQEVSLTTADGLHISAWLVPVSNPKAIVILLPGFTDTHGGRALMLPHAQYLRRAGYTTLLVDVRTSGDSQGEKTYLGMKEWQEVDAAYSYVAAQPESKGKKIGVFGISMGGVTAIIAAGKLGLGDFVIASVPFANFDGLFKSQILSNHLPVWLFLPLLRLAAVVEFGRQYSDYDPQRWAPLIKSPVFIIAAKRDRVIPYAHGKALYSCFVCPKKFWLADTGHDVHLENPRDFEANVIDFLDSTVSR